jgi:opacity protein-like surface antigen
VQRSTGNPRYEGKKSGKDPTPDNLTRTHRKGGSAMKKSYSLFLVLGLAAFLLTASPSAAPAEEAGPFYFGILGGWVAPQNLKVQNEPDVSLKNSWELGAKAGYIIPQTQKWLAVEMEYQYLANQDLDVSTASGHYSANNLLFNLLVRWPEGKWHPYAGGGIGYSWGAFNASGTYAGTTGSVDTTAGAFAWQLMLGVNFEFSPKWSADISYRYFSSVYNVDLGGGSRDVTAADSMILLGVNYHF